MFVTTDLLFEAGLMGSKLLKIESQLALGEQGAVRAPESARNGQFEAAGLGSLLRRLALLQATDPDSGER